GILATSTMSVGGGVIGISQNNAAWSDFPATTYADGYAPTLGRVYDPAHADASLGSWNIWWGGATNPTVPLDPLITADTLGGHTVAATAQLYGISAGGTAVDISSLGFSSINYVRVTNPTLAGDGIVPQVDAVARVLPTEWAGASSGNYGDKLKWTSQVVPDVRTPAAYFRNTISVPATVTIDLPVNIALLKFDSVQGYTLVGASRITLAPQYSGATPVAPGITVLSGSQVIQAPVVLGGNTTVNVAASSRLTLSGGISGSGKMIVQSGGLVVSGSNTYAGGTEVDGGVVTFSTAAGRPTGDVLTLGKSGTPAQGGMVVVGADGVHLDTYRSALAASFTKVGGNWVWSNGGSIRTNLGTWGAKEGIGYMTGAQYMMLHPTVTGIAAGDVVLKYTYLGDTTLKGYITASDFAQMDAAWLKVQGGAPNAGFHWINGDFNYDGQITPDDFAILDAAYAQQLGGLANDPFYAGNLAAFGPAYAQAVAGQLAGGGAVPEPASLGLLAGGVAGMLGRKRRRAARMNGK
ncbi:MAG: PEP-CTERM sorting domain-containing protein, partial [Phycisphaerae bacterium]